MNGAKGKRAVEWLKTALIAILTISALLLGWQTGLFDEFFRVIPLFANMAELVKGTAATGSGEPGGVPIKEAARPSTVIITDKDGGRFGVKYDTKLRNDVYDMTSRIVSEALSSASESAEINESEWRQALSGPGVYFEYFTPVRVSILSGWLGAKLPDSMGDTLLRRIFVAFGEEISRVYYYDESSGLFYAADTASFAGESQELEAYPPNGTLFAYETGIKAAENAPYTIILPDYPHQDVRAVSAGSTEEILDLVLSAIGHGNETYAPYESEGALVRVGTQFYIRADVYGRVAYRRTEMLPFDSGVRLPGENAMIEMARIIAADTIGSIGSNAEVFFETLEYGAGGTLSVYFAYYIAGGCIRLAEDGYAARITFTDGNVTDIELVFRNYSLSGETNKLYREKQALAAAGGEFMMCYYDTGAERLQPVWVHSS